MRDSEKKREYNRHYARELAQQRRMSGLCQNCGKPAREGKSQCQECSDYQLQHHAAYRKRKKEESSDDDIIRQAKGRQRVREFIQQQKTGRVCGHCGNADIRVLDFHHLTQSEKRGGLGQAPSQRWSQKRILDEIAKCQVLCANCHRLVHWEERHGKE